MAKRRDYRAEEARRNDRFQAEGWDSYSQYRYARAKFKKSSPDTQGKYNRFLALKGLNLSKTEERRAFWAFWKGVIDPRTRDDTSRDSPKAHWFTFYDTKRVFRDAEGNPSLDKWEERYPTLSMAA